MSNSSRQSVAVPEGWRDVFIRTLIVLVVSFLTLVVKEYAETREFDFLACVIDAGCVAAGIFLFYAILTAIWGGSRGTEERMAVPASR